MHDTLSASSKSPSSISDAQLALALEAADMGAWQWDVRANRVSWSPSLERMHGLEPGTFEGTFEAYQRDIHPDDRERVFATISQSVNERHPHHLEYRIVRPDGQVRWLEARGRLVLDEQGAPAQLIGVCMDVTDKRTRDEDLRAVQARQVQAETELQEQTRLALLARDIGLALTRPADLRTILQACVQAVVDHLGAAFARIWTLNSAEQALELQASAGMYTHIDGPHGRVPVGKFKIGLIAEERQPHLTNTVVGDPRVGDQEWAKREGMIAFAGYPLIIAGELVGVLAMFARHPLTDKDFDGLASVANAIAVGIARDRADEVMRKSEERYRFLAESAPTQVWTARPTGQVDYCNTQMNTYFGCDFAALTLEEQSGYAHPDDRAEALAHWGRALETGTPLEFEGRLRRHDGQYRWHIIRATPYAEDGTVIKWFGTDTDVHDLKEARLTLAARADELARIAADLQYQRDLTETIANNAASALFMMDTNGFPIFMNTAACEMTGYAGLHEITGKPLHYSVHFRKPDGSYYPMEECPIDQANAEIVPLRAQREIFCRKDGTLFPVEYNVAPIARSEKRLGAVIEVRDITGELEAQRALRMSDERLHLLARATNDTIWDWDLDAGTVWWNENFTTMFGYPLSALEPGPESWTNRIHPDDHERVVHGIHEAIDGAGDSWTDEYRFRRADGSYAIILDRAIIVRNDQGQARRLTGSMMDITERREADEAVRRHAEQLAQLAEALQRSNRELDQFAYVASHDLKAPLRGIANLSQWVEEDLGEAVTGTSREHLDLLRKRVQRMEALIDGILEYSRAGRSTTASEEVAVGRVVRDVIDLIAPPTRIAIEVAPDLPVVEAPRLLLQQVFMNLIGNAVKYGSGGAEPRITIGARRGEGAWEFTVTDNGPGIAPPFHDKVWGIFQTLQPRDQIEGTGIGLALVKKIAETRGGRVWIESSEGAGATFGFSWPDKTGDRQ